MAVNLLREIRIAPTQTRVVPLGIAQTASFPHHELRMDLTVVTESASRVISLTLPVTHHPLWTSSNFIPIRASHFFAEFNPTLFLALPPVEARFEKPRPPILALRTIV